MFKKYFFVFDTSVIVIGHHRFLYAQLSSPKTNTFFLIPFKKNFQKNLSYKKLQDWKVRAKSCKMFVSKFEYKKTIEVETCSRSARRSKKGTRAPRGLRGEWRRGRRGRGDRLHAHTHAHATRIHYYLPYFEYSTHQSSSYALDIRPRGTWRADHDRRRIVRVERDGCFTPRVRQRAASSVVGPRMCSVETLAIVRCHRASVSDFTRGWELCLEILIKELLFCTFSFLLASDGTRHVAYS